MDKINWTPEQFRSAIANAARTGDEPIELVVQALSLFQRLVIATEILASPPATSLISPNT